MASHSSSQVSPTLGLWGHWDQGRQERPRQDRQPLWPFARKQEELLHTLPTLGTRTHQGEASALPDITLGILWLLSLSELLLPGTGSSVTKELRLIINEN